MSCIKEFYHQQICEGLEEQKKYLESLEKEYTNYDLVI